MQLPGSLLKQHHKLANLLIGQGSTLYGNSQVAESRLV